MVDVIQRQLFARRDHVNTIVLESPKVCAGTRSSIFKISLVWLSAVLGHVKTRLHLLATNFGW